MPKEATNKIIDLCEEGFLSWKSLAIECLARMSEDDVRDMAEECGFD